MKFTFDMEVEEMQAICKTIVDAAKLYHESEQLNVANKAKEKVEIAKSEEIKRAREALERMCK